MNAFLDLADHQIGGPRKAQQRAAERRAARKAADDRDRLNAAWRQWLHDRVEDLLVGQYGEAARELVAFLDRMMPGDGAALISAAERWRGADADVRFEILSLIDAAVIGLRERAGLPPFDDPLPDERPNVFLIVRELLA
jgi:hypothetical protein